MCVRAQGGRWGVPVAESALAPPGPIPNPVVTQGSAGEYCGGDPVGGEAAAGTPQRPPGAAHPYSTRRGVEQWQLVGLITQRSEVRILPPLPDVYTLIPPGSPPSRGGFSIPPTTPLRRWCTLPPHAQPIRHSG